MRVLYANRRLSIQPDSIIIPSTESDDVPLVHDILDRLGLLGSKDLDTHSQTSEIPIEKPQTQPSQKPWSTSSVQSSLFTSPFEAPSTIADPMLFDMPALPEFDNTEDLLAMDADMSLNFPYEVYETINATKGDMFNHFTPNFSMAPQTVDWCPLNVLDEVLHGSYPVEQSWPTDPAPGFGYWLLCILCIPWCVTMRNLAHWLAGKWVICEYLSGAYLNLAGKRASILAYLGVFWGNILE